MTQRIEDWLPLNALDHRQIFNSAQDAVGVWSQRWFGKNGYGALKSGFGKRLPPSNATKGEWREEGPVVFEWSADSATAIACRAIDASPAKVTFSEIDRHLLLKLSDEIFSDLSATLADRLRLVAGSSFSTFGGLELTLPRSGNLLPSVRIAIPVGALTSFRKSLVAPQQPLPHPTGALTDLVGDEQLAFRVRLGGARLSAADLCELAEGDVIVLDTHLKGSVPFVAKRSGRSIGRVSVSSNAGAVELRVAEIGGK